jgi:hypothetical protein
MSITFTTTHGGPELNVANGNAVDLLQLLGLPAEAWGEAPAEDFLGRVLMAQALLDVATDDEHGRPEVFDEQGDLFGVTVGQVIWCGRRPGYLAERLAELHQIAHWANQFSAEVQWG